MNPEQWQKVSSALDELLDLEPAARVPFLDRLRQDDPQLCREVESLLAHQTSTDVFEGVQQALDNVQSTDMGIVTAAVAATPPPRLPGQAGRYVIQEQLARGGMGAILRAFDPDIRRTLAVKIMLPRARLDPHARQRFLREAQITGRLQHPGIPPIHELGFLEDDSPFFAMKLIEGRTLTALLADGTVAGDDAHLVGIFEQICRTLAYAHSQRIIHRDLKPGNVMVGAFGEVQVMDWGLAKDLHAKAGATDEPQLHDRPARRPPPPGNGLASSITQTGTVTGTPAFMAPEQARGETSAQDERCDVFGLGGILCAILTGQPPFRGSVQDMVQLAADGDLRATLQSLDACKADAALVAIAKKCLAGKQEERYASAGEVAAAVTRYREGAQEKLRQAELARETTQVQLAEERKRRVLEEAKTRAERRRRQHTLALSLLVLLLLAVAGSMGLWYQGERARLDQEEAQRAADAVKRRAELAATQQKVGQEVVAALDRSEAQRGELHKLLADPVQTSLLLGNINRWEADLNQCRQAWKRARAVASGNAQLLAPELTARLDQLDAALQVDEREFELAKKLDEIRVGTAGRVGSWFDAALAGPRYAKLFQEDLQLDLKNGKVDELAARLEKSPIRYALVATLDHWALALYALGDRPLRTQLLEVARRVDPDVERNGLRNEAVWWDARRLQKLVAGLNLASQSPPFLAAVSFRLEAAQCDPVPLMRVALIHHPQDFWLNFELGLKLASKKPGEAAGYLQAALAVRSTNSIVFAALGNALFWHRDFPGSVAAYRQAIRLDPQFADAHCNLGLALNAQDDLTGAAAAFRQALASLDPRNERLGSWTYYNLAGVLLRQGLFAEALKALHAGKALAGWPDPEGKNVIAHCERMLAKDIELAAVLEGKTEPKDAAALIDLARHCLHVKKMPAAAARFYDDAFAHDANLVSAHRYAAACAAAQAGSDAGNDAATLDTAAKSRLRQRAQSLLRAELAAQKRRLQTYPAQALDVHLLLEQMATNPGLAGVREPKSLDRWPETERRSWRQFWNDLDKTRRIAAETR